jgi:3-dehydroquinate synthetase
MADAAIGGKTAIDHPRGKNLLGAFHPPLGVLIDPGLLDTLPPRQFRSGLAEVYKAALIGDAESFRAMAGRLEAIAASREVDAPLEAAVAVKRRIVARDPRDRNERMILNFGHTLGHALERWDGYRRFTHGECVCVGMAAALDLSAERCGFPKAEADSLSRELAAFAGREIARALEPEAPELWDALSRDKKFSSAARPAVLLARPGEPRVVEVPAEEWKRALVRVRERIVL